VRTGPLSRRVMVSTAASLVVMLLLCPALTRVIRVQSLVSPSTTYAPSFQRSLDVPPNRQLVLPDLAIVAVTVPSLTPFDTLRWLRPLDDALTWSFLGTSTRPLRAPPVGLS
jgi:hypothetical protein